MDITLLQRERWHGGQLLAFSGLDGKTDFFNGLTARTAPDTPAIDIKLPGTCRLRFPNPSKILLAGDFFELQTGAGPVRGAFLDACHLLLEGPVEVSRTDPAVAVLRDRGRTLIGS